jgi:hypothetical protein
LYGVLAAVVVLFLWRKFSPKPIVRTEILDPLDPVDPSDPTNDGPPGQASEPEGIVAAGLLTRVTAQIIEPAKGSRVYRSLFRSTFPAVIEVVHEGGDVAQVQVEALIDFHEYAGTVRRNVRTLLPAVVMAPGDVHRFEVELESDNVNNLAFEVGQADAIARVFVNGVQTQATSFEVW